MEKLNLFQKIVKLKEQTKGFNKDTKSFGYSYVSGSQILDKITPIMNELGLLFLPKEAIHRNWIERTYVTKKNETKVDFVVDGKLTYCWINADEPSQMWEIPFEYYGSQDDISKAFGSALTYSERYLLLKSLGLSTDEDDPDSRDTRDNQKSKSVQTKTRTSYNNATGEVKKTQAEEMAESNNSAYKDIYKQVYNNTPTDDLETHKRKQLVKDMITEYIAKDLKLSMTKVEFSNVANAKPTTKDYIIVNVGETIEKVTDKVKEELAIFDSEGN